MAENKKDKSAEFARDKSAFDKGGSEKGTASQKAQHKHSGTHQPRDANDTSRDVPKKEQSETFGQNVQKSGQSAKRRNKKQILIKNFEFPPGLFPAPDCNIGASVV